MNFIFCSELYAIFKKKTIDSFELFQAEEKAKLREEKEKKEKVENQWLLPSISKKIDKMSSSLDPSKSKKKKSKKSKKVKKEKKSKKKKKKRSRSGSGNEIQFIFSNASSNRKIQHHILFANSTFSLETIASN